MSLIDYLLVLVPLFVIFAIGIKAQSYIRSVSDFLSAGRCAGRYLLSVADGSAAVGLITVIGSFEMYYRTGNSIGFWSGIGLLVGLFMTLTGFVAYRYRETRAMTLAQFFEMRYSHGFRIFAGLISFWAGILNYALFPAIGGRFFLYYCGYPETFRFLGLEWSTFGVLMALFLGMALLIVMMGGQLTTMITDCLQGIFSYFAYSVLVCVVLYSFSFNQFREAMFARPPGYSFINPFDTGMMTDFNIFFVLIGCFYSVYCRMAWQGNQAYNSCGASPHEQKMGGVLGVWRNGFQTVAILLLVFGAYVYMNHADFSAQAAQVNAELDRIQFASVQTTQTIQGQMRVPMALRSIFPVGVTGIFCALALFLMLSTDTTYLHSWGSILVQDVILPFRRKPLSPKAHLRLLRLGIFAVAVFAWIFSFYFGQVTYILMFFAITGTIYLGGAGSAIIGGLYWRRGTTAGAWAAMLFGCIGGLGGFLIQKFWETPIYPYLQANFPGELNSFGSALEAIGRTVPILNWKMSSTNFPISGQEFFFFVSVISILLYLVVSLLTCRRPFNLEKMLHRGKYNLEHTDVADCRTPKKNWSNLGARLLGITSEYTRGDRIIAYSVLAWTLLCFCEFLFVIVVNAFIVRWQNEQWFLYWKYITIGQGLLYGLVTTVWFTWGGLRDLRRLFRHLQAIQDIPPDENDDGRIISDSPNEGTHSTH